VPAKSDKQQRGTTLTMLGRPRWHCDEFPVMDGGFDDGVRTIGTGRGCGKEGVPRGGQTHAEVRKRRKGVVLSGLPVGAERRKGKMGVGSWEREEGGGGPSARGDNGS
jgi:hypothetical protein